jgi:hydroxymethylpyrimidine pyrophosphatase-like HAD family hydrolase
MIIAIDFDGTLHDGEDWPAIGQPLPYAIKVMQQLKEDGHDLIIWSCREGRYGVDMVNWIIEHQIPFDRINEHAPNDFPYESRKIYSDIYIDDHNLGGFPSWREIYDIVSGKVKPFWIYKLQK